jgi:hypothetical protein
MDHQQAVVEVTATGPALARKMVAAIVPCLLRPESFIARVADHTVIKLHSSLTI